MPSFPSMSQRPTDSINGEFLVKDRLRFILNCKSAKPLMERPIKRTHDYTKVTVLCECQEML